MCRVFETSRKQVSFILALEVGQIGPGSTAGAALCNTSFGQDKSGIRWTNRDSIVHDWLYLPCPRGASHPVSLTCTTDWHFLFHPHVLACALASRQHSKFISGQVGTEPASNQRRFRFQDHLFDHTDLLRGLQDRAEAHADAKLAEIAFHRATVESWLTLQDLCIFF